MNAQPKTNIIAIDPGASGGIAIYTGSECEAHAMPDDVEITSLLSKYRPLNERGAVVYMEQVGGMIFVNGKNVANGSSMFNFGDGFGFIRGLCAAFGIKLVLVTPKKWQKGIAYAASAKDKAERKRAYKEHAARLFPGIVPTLKTADALCLLEYAMRQENGTTPMQNSFALRSANVAKLRKGARYSEAQAAIAWCKLHGWEPPLTGTAEFSKMIHCYRARERTNTL